MKPHLHRVNRIFDYTDKSEYDFILNQSERSQPIPEPYYTEFIRSLKQEDFAYYPNTKNFKEKICEFYNVNTENLFLSDGSDVGIKSIFETFTTCGNIVTSEPSFPMYGVYASLYNCPYKGINYDVDTLEFSIDNMLSFVDDDTELIILANPNSPIGDYKTFEEIKPLLDTGKMVLIDEAYTEFSGKESFIKYINDYPNLIITRTFSKAYGLAALRIGYSLSHPDIANLLNRVRQPFNNNGLALVAADIALEDTEYIKNSIKLNQSGIDQLTRAFDDMGLDYIPSKSNFLCVNFEEPALKIYKSLLKTGVIVRPISDYDMPNHLRVTIGIESENDKFIKELQKIMVK